MSRSARGDGSVEVLGVPVHPWTPETLVGAMVQCAAEGKGALAPPPVTVLYANVHVLNVAYRNSQLRRQLRSAGTVYCDGSGVRLGARLSGGRLPPRLTAADWIDPLCSGAAEAGVSLFLLGGKAGIAERAARILEGHHPVLRVAGVHHGYLDEQMSRGVVEEMNRSRAQLVLVGMGTPIQEAWIDHWRAEINAPVVWAVGALLDFVAGAQTRAPRWMRENHMEWLWRLGTDPVRLGRRYLLGNPVFLSRVLLRRWLPIEKY